MSRQPAAGHRAAGQVRQAGPAATGDSLKSTEKSFASEAVDIAAELGTQTPVGLDEGEAARRLRAHGPNSLRLHEKRSALGILAHQFRSLIVWLLAAAAVLSLILGDIADAVAICVVLLLNSAIGFVTELRAARSMEALLRITEVSCRVRRDGKTRVINAKDLVPGDIVLLEAGDVVSADLRLVSVSNLYCDESLLTGESAPVIKQVTFLPEETPLAERTNMAFSGTAVTQGLGEGIVVSTGMATQLGHISSLAQKADEEASPLERRLDILGQKLVWLTIVLAAATSLAGMAWGHSIPEMLKTGVALAVAAIPEGLPVVATLCLARGLLRMANRNALVTKLSAVETLGATTLILTDKTGTLTENRMTAVGYLTDRGAVGVSRGDAGVFFTAEDRQIDPRTWKELDWALTVGALCNTAEWDGKAAVPGIGDPMEISLLETAAGTGFDRATLHEEFVPVGQHAFDPVRKMMATVHACDGRYLYAVKGAPEAVIKAASGVLGKDGIQPITEEDREAWLSRQAEAARSGQRLLALACKWSDMPSTKPYEDLCLLALVCFLDPLRAEIPEAISACQNAGVRIVMMTGDHADTAAKIAQEAGIGRRDPKVLSGQDVGEQELISGDKEAQIRLMDIDVFARVAPETKFNLVSLFQDGGHVVAMTGDGVNDAPALKKADIGIAMGQRGTQVAREASDIVLKDDNFATIVDAMRQGRIIFGNIRKFVLYLMSCNVSEVLIVGIAVGIGLPVPLLPLQILFLNLVTDVFPAFALGLGQGDDEVMVRPPRDPRAPIVDRHGWFLIAFLGGAITLATLGAFAVALFQLELAPESAVSVAFVTLALAQLWNVFNVRSASTHFLKSGIVRNGYVWAALALCVVLIVLALAHPGLSGILGLPWPGLEGVLVAIGASFLPLALGQGLLLIEGGKPKTRSGIATAPGEGPGTP
ncbi:cation-translocating P-type ATPase [Roseibium sediminicola]|uniref:Cation-transporting P-type ATPase n=1 Tax=Roseibium sediminicola TaxID=2933272 RepID=A0ABT0GSN3_9HYPH|nr:cation-transporting P-type ATPase [Roseibium sp. CAU 1639]MCK7611803.1 cation-transporting P-type ATPase [Roseibium sp. CAU 1639]